MLGSPLLIWGEAGPLQFRWALLGQGSTDVSFAWAWLSLKCSSSRPGLWEAGITCAVGLGHTAGPGDFSSPVSESVSWDGMDKADCY